MVTVTIEEANYTMLVGEMGLGVSSHYTIPTAELLNLSMTIEALEE